MFVDDRFHVVHTAVAMDNMKSIGLGWGLYLWIRVVSWPCGKTKLMRAHARGGKLGKGPG